MQLQRIENSKLSVFFFQMKISFERKKHSTKNPTEVFVSDDGRFVFNGQIFKSKEELEKAIKIYSSLAKKASTSRFWRFFLGIKK